MATYRFTSNVPTRVEIDYIDVVGGEYGPQVRINGKFAANGEDLLKAYGYLPGKAADSLGALLRAGVIADMPGINLPEAKDDKPLAVKPRCKAMRITARQPAGQKHATTYAEVIDGKAPAPQASSRAPAAPPHEDRDRHETGGEAPPSRPQNAPLGDAVPYSNPLYLSIVQFVAMEVEPMAKMTPEAFFAAVATLYIAETRNGSAR